MMINLLYLSQKVTESQKHRAMYSSNVSHAHALWSGLLRCKGATNCVPSDKICDGEPQCTLYRDDEKYCEVTGQSDALPRSSYTTGQLSMKSFEGKLIPVGMTE